MTPCGNCLTRPIQRDRGIGTAPMPESLTGLIERVTYHKIHGVEGEVAGDVILSGTAYREKLSSGMRKKPGVEDRQSIRHREPPVVGTGKGGVI